MTRKLVTTGSPFEEKFAYSRAVAQGDWCFCAGTTGYDYDKMEMPEDAADQTRNIFRTIERSLTETGFSLADIVRIHIIVTDWAHLDAAGPVLREYLGDVRPASMAVLAGLHTPEMKIEIEATAYRAR